MQVKDFVPTLRGMWVLCLRSTTQHRLADDLMRRAIPARRTSHQCNQPCAAGVVSGLGNCKARRPEVGVCRMEEGRSLLGRSCFRAFFFARGRHPSIAHRQLARLTKRHQTQRLHAPPLSAHVPCVATTAPSCTLERALQTLLRSRSFFGFTLAVPYESIRR